MKIVIDIPEEYYNVIKAISDIQCTADMLIIKNGTPLPEQHGRIIDESKINKVFCYKEEAIYNNIKAINTTITHTDAPTIIEGSDSA